MKSVEERRQNLRDRFPEWEPRTLDGWLDQCVSLYGDRPFVITDEVTLTYTDVSEQSRVLADALVSLGVKPGDRVGMLMANYPEFVPFKFAIARTGAIAIPFNYLYRAEELGYVLAQSGCSVLLTMTGFGSLDYLGMLDTLTPGWEARPDLGELRQVITLSTDSRSRPGAMTYNELFDLGRANAGAADDAEHSPTDIGDMLYTSGSTGSPKGVVVTHDAVLRTGYASALTRAYDDGRRILFSLPCYHMFGYVEGILSATMVGGAVILQTSFSAEGYLCGIERHRADDILCVPTMAVAIVECPARENYDLSSLTAILCGSAPAPIWLWEKVEELFGVSEIVTGYGMTECGGAMTLTRPEDPLILTSTTAGRPKAAGVAGVEGTDDLCVYSTVDPVTGDALPTGDTGELVSHGPTTMLGYWGKPDETHAALPEDGLLRSGDLGRVRPDGYLEVTGRSKELYKSGGELVMPKEIEDLVARLDAVSQAFAIGIIDDRWGEIGCLVIVRAPASLITEHEVIEYCKEHLARFKIPKRVVFLDADQLPTTPTGKIQKYRLVDMVSKSA
ncbi:class I adenylate-forming enzyme family protein [Gordonia polyisoprenivorans]|uniref:class I adenylate-forming enzyme family protein n=1 Tax=Gordonia polyisoprenivorans TaxID=84595 RepID=UPI001AD74311|nr:class I adenylate-forming enzyme family protein [Gordonia polyisoprenivorans]QTI69046.1 acyl--CoA ligase [Gordonia polyisoprenivorans]